MVTGDRLGVKRASNGSVVQKQRWVEVNLFVNVTHDCRKDVTTWAQEHFVKPLSGNTVHLQIIEFIFIIYITYFLVKNQGSTFWYCKLFIGKRF